MMNAVQPKTADGVLAGLQQASTHNYKVEVFTLKHNLLVSLAWSVGGCQENDPLGVPTRTGRSINRRLCHSVQRSQERRMRKSGENV